MTRSRLEAGEDACEVAIAARDLAVDRNEVERTLGYAEGGTPAHFLAMIDRALEQIPQVCEIRAGYRLLPVTPSAGSSDALVLGGTKLQTGSMVTGFLKKAEMAAVFICTIGPGMETWAKRVSGEEPVFGYIADTVASLAAENLSNALHDRIGAAAAARGWKATNRYSPGYCDWPVSDQHLVFSLLPDGFCGITLTDSALMIPVKSVSGIIGVGPGVRRLEYSCDRCGMKDCTYRSVRSRRSTVGSRRKGVITPKGNAT